MLFKGEENGPKGPAKLGGMCDTEITYAGNLKASFQVHPRGLKMRIIHKCPLGARIRNYTDKNRYYT